MQLGWPSSHDSCQLGRRQQLEPWTQLWELKGKSGGYVLSQISLEPG